MFIPCMSVSLTCVFISVYVDVNMWLHAEWSPGTDGFILSSRRNIAMRCDSAPSGSPVLYSNGATYCPGQTLTFK